MKTPTLIALYLLAIVAANLMVVMFGPSVTIVNAFLFIGLDLTSRDRLHAAWHGRGLVWKMAALIATGSALSYALSAGAGRIALASFVAFSVSAALDAVSYALLEERAYMVKVNGSNVISATADSVIFPTLAFGVFLPWIILGQLIAKVIGGAVWAYLLRPRDG